MLVSPRYSPPSKALARSLIALGLLALSCAPQGDGPSVEAKVAAVSAAGTTDPGNLDLLFMLDNSPDTAVVQKKLASQISTFIDALANLPGGLPNIHVAVITSDLGAPGDSTASIGCTTAGDQGLFQLAPSCIKTTLTPTSATYLSNVGGAANYTGSLADLLTCILPLGESTCGFGHQLASIARALGADGAPAPAQNAGFLRPDAELAIVVLSPADDCSAPPTTTLYSLNGPNANLTNALGPITTFRCNRWGHLCIDPTGDPTKATQPPLIPPADAQGPSSAPTLNMTSCQSLEDDSLLTPVSTFIGGIKALKSDPDNQIVVGAIVAPPAPYAIAWLANNAKLVPEIEHSCGSGSDVNPTGQVSTDGTFGDPAVRISEWVQGFGANGVTTSICDGSYANGFGAIVGRIAAHLPGGGVTPTTSGTGDTGTTGGTGTGGAMPTGGTGAGGMRAGVDGGGGGGGTMASAAGGSGVGGTAPATGGREPAHPQLNGLTSGGCDVSAGRPSASGLVLLAALLVVVRLRQRLTRFSRRGGLPG
jgi:hypothetical protein